MKIIVTGGLGFIGSNFIRHMITAYSGYRIINIDKCTYSGNAENLKDVEVSPRYKWLRADICDREKVFSCVRGADVIVHFAAETHVDRSILEPSAFVRTNVLGTQVLLEAARQCKVSKFVHVSTDEVYGSKESGESLESDLLLPNSPYA
ncbi:MAG: GDP-mannose 4,6-dehydratase, partial [bacterium]